MAIHINIIDILKVQGVFCTHCGHRIDGCVWIVGVIVKRAVRKYKQARNGKNGVTPKYQVLTLIVITIAAGSAKAGHSRDVGPDIHGVLRLSIAYP